MLSVHIERVGDMAVVECDGSIVSNEAAFTLRDAVTSQGDARIVVLDLSEVTSIEGGGLGMLVFLQRWAHDHEIRFKLFNPSRSVKDNLEHASSISAFEIATPDETMALLALADNRSGDSAHANNMTSATGKSAITTLDLTKWLEMVGDALAEEDKTKRDDLLESANTFLKRSHGDPRDAGSATRLDYAYQLPVYIDPARRKRQH